MCVCVCARAFGAVGAGKRCGSGELGASGATVGPQGAGGDSGEIREAQREAGAANQGNQTALLRGESTGKGELLLC